MPNRTRLIIFGIDGATWDLMDPWLEAGLLPNLAQVVRTGCRAPLRSIIPPITGCAWPTIMTGTNPGKHGMFGLSTYGTDYRARPVSNLDRQAPVLWEMLGELGCSVAVYNVPITYPPDRVRGVFVSGEMGAVEFDPSMFQPQGLFDEVFGVVPDYVIAPLKPDADGYDLDALRRQVEARRKTAVYLLEKHPADVFIAVVNYVDHISHFFWQTRAYGEFEDLLLWGYQQADQLLGELMEVAGEGAAVMLLSDHGFGSVAGFLDLNALLAQLGFLKVRDPAPERGRARSLAARAYRTFLRPLLSDDRRESVHRSLGGGGLPFDPARTRAYQAGPFLCARLNLKGREIHGRVAPADQHRMCADIAEALNEVTNPFSGDKDLGAFAAAGYYHGPYTGLGPDILGVPQGFSLDQAGIPGNFDRPFLTREDLRAAGNNLASRQATHRMHGILACRLPSEAAALTVEVPELVDITPTALALLSLPLPAHLDGRVVLDVPEERDTQTHAWQPARPDSEAAYTDEERRTVERRLRDLGYL